MDRDDWKMIMIAEPFPLILCALGIIDIFPVMTPSFLLLGLLSLAGFNFFILFGLSIRKENRKERERISIENEEYYKRMQNLEL